MKRFIRGAHKTYGTVILLLEKYRMKKTLLYECLKRVRINVLFI